MDYIKDFKKEYWSGIDQEREFTSKDSEFFKKYYPGRSKEIIKTLNEIKSLWTNDNFLITHIKDKGYLCFETTGDGSCSKLIRDLEGRTMDHCVECGEEGESRRPYGCALCDKCFNNSKY